MYVCSNTIQEALLPQTNCATRYFSQNLVNCRTANLQPIEVIASEGYSRPTSSKQPRLVDCRVSVVNKLDRRRRRRLLLTTRPTCRGEFFQSEAWDKVPAGSTLIFEDTWTFLQDSVRLSVQRSSRDKNQPDSSVVSREIRL